MPNSPSPPNVRFYTFSSFLSLPFVRDVAAADVFARVRARREYYRSFSDIARRREMAKNVKRTRNKKKSRDSNGDRRQQLDDAEERWVGKNYISFFRKLTSPSHFLSLHVRACVALNKSIIPGVSTLPFVQHVCARVEFNIIRLSAAATFRLPRTRRHSFALPSRRLFHPRRVDGRPPLPYPPLCTNI